MKRNTKYLITVLLLLIYTAGYIYAIQNLDVQAVGPQGTSVGFATINKAVADSLGFNQQIYKITQLLGLMTFAVAGLFAVLGLAQVIRRRSLLKMDRSFWALAALYVVTAGLYVAFEHFIVNYRPVIMPDNTVPEASFPSSHTMLACVVMGSAVMMTGRYVESRALRWLLQLLLILMMAAIVVGRLLSGVHWLTDIIGGILISIVLLVLFSWMAGKKR